MHPLSFRLVTIAAAVTLHAVPAYAQQCLEQQTFGGGIEARCLELGEGCQCSEPLRFSCAGQIGNTGGFNPPDSRGDTECRGGNALIKFNSSPYGVTTPGASVGLPQLEFVYNANRNPASPSNNFQTEIVDRDTEFTGGTFCMRSYWSRSVEGDHPAPGGHDDWKMWGSEGKSVPVRIGTGGSWGGSSNPDGPSSLSTGGLASASDWGWPFQTSQPKDPGSDTVTMDDCTAPNWCRLENCFDHNGDLTLTWRSRLISLDGPTGEHKKEMRWSLTPSGTNSVAWVGGRPLFVQRMYCEYNTSGRTCPDYYATHVMTAMVHPRDSAFWIGAATEVESPGAAAVLSPPPAPVLLP